jgi:hypothetical protein
MHVFRLDVHPISVDEQDDAVSVALGRIVNRFSKGNLVHKISRVDCDDSPMNIELFRSLQLDVSSFSAILANGEFHR